MPQETNTPFWRHRSEFSELIYKIAEIIRLYFGDNPSFKPGLIIAEISEKAEKFNNLETGLELLVSLYKEVFKKTEQLYKSNKLTPAELEGHRALEAKTLQLIMEFELQKTERQYAKIAAKPR